MCLMNEKKRLQELVVFLEQWLADKKNVPNVIVVGLVSMHEKAEARIRKIDLEIEKEGRR